MTDETYFLEADTEAENGAETEVEAVDEAGPELIATHYLASIDDVVEHLRAANQLGLGVRVHSFLEQDEDGQTVTDGWELDLLTGSPLRQDDAAE